MHNQDTPQSQVGQAQHTQEEKIIRWAETYNGNSLPLAAGARVIRSAQKGVSIDTAVAESLDIATRAATLPAEKQATLLALLRLMSPAPLTEQEQAEALALVKTEAERWRASGEPCTGLESFLLEFEPEGIPAELAHKARPTAPEQVATQKERS